MDQVKSHPNFIEGNSNNSNIFFDFKSNFVDGGMSPSQDFQIKISNAPNM